MPARFEHGWQWRKIRLYACPIDAHLYDLETLGQRPPAPELVVPIRALERGIVRLERIHGALGRAVVRDAIVLSGDRVQQLLDVLWHPRLLDRRTAALAAVGRFSDLAACYAARGWLLATISSRLRRREI